MNRSALSSVSAAESALGLLPSRALSSAQVIFNIRCFLLSGNGPLSVFLPALPARFASPFQFAVTVGATSEFVGRRGQWIGRSSLDQLQCHFAG